MPAEAESTATPFVSLVGVVHVYPLRLSHTAVHASRLYQPPGLAHAAVDAVVGAVYVARNLGRNTIGVDM